MARQSTTPVSFMRGIRKDTAVLMSSARAGIVVCAGSIPVLPGDSVSGSVGIDVMLKEMPKPLLNGVTANLQAWFVPKSAYPQFGSRDELMHAMTGETIRVLGQVDRVPPAYFTSFTSAARNQAYNSEMFTTLGIHLPVGASFINADLIDAMSLIYNFRLAAHSSRLPLRKYASEDMLAATTPPPAFWPSSRLSRVVPDYERALVVGSLDLDVIAGRIPVSGIGRDPGVASTPGNYTFVDTFAQTAVSRRTTQPQAAANQLTMRMSATDQAEVFAEMAGQLIGVSLNDIDTARKAQAFAKVRTAYAGNDATGFDNGDTIVALLMQGLSVPDESFKRPWMLDSKRVPVGFVERNATDGPNLAASVTTGRASAVLNLNVPQQDVGGMIVFTIEVLPERIDERMSDEHMLITSFDQLPNALRDVQRTEPVDLVLNRRIDAKHTTPSALYGYEPMNDKWNRDFTRLGGDFYMATPGGGWTENRSSIWQTEIVDPTFSTTHYLAPAPFPHDVFANQNGDAFEFVVRHAVTIVGLTQIGDVLAENGDDYDAVTEAGL